MAMDLDGMVPSGAVYAELKSSDVGRVEESGVVDIMAELN